MIKYLVRRLLYAIPVLLGVNLITFILFFSVNSPDDMARAYLGQKYITQATIEQWKKSHGYDLPMFYNSEVSGIAKLKETLFFKKSLSLFAFDFGQSDSGRNIGDDIRHRMFPSLAIAIPSLLLGLFLNMMVALLLVFFRNTYIETTGVILCIVLMSISGLFYIIFGQFFVAKLWRLVPISGYLSGIDGLKFLILPVLVAIFSGLGMGARWYRSLFLEEIFKDYVRTARAKGMTEHMILLKHVLRNALIPILTGVVVLIPSLFLGSLLLESFFGVPGLGSYTIDAINQQDFAIVRAMIFLGSLLYILGLVLTDFSYTLVDPRVRLE